MYIQTQHYFGIAGNKFLWNDMVYHGYCTYYSWVDGKNDIDFGRMLILKQFNSRFWTLLKTWLLCSPKISNYWNCFVENLPPLRLSHIYILKSNVHLKQVILLFRSECLNTIMTCCKSTLFFKKILSFWCL